MAYCEQCGEMNVDGAAVCVKCNSFLGGGPAAAKLSGNHVSSPYSPPVAAANSDTVTIGDWLLTNLIMIIPLVNIILLFVWAFDSNTKPSKKNWARAALLWIAICFVIMIMFVIVFGAALAGFLSHAGGY